MRSRFDLVVLLMGSLAAAGLAGCAAEPGPAPDPADPAAESRSQAAHALTGACGIGGDVLASETLTPAAIPGLSALERRQIVLAVQESAHTDVTTVEEAFDRVDGHEINRIVLRYEPTNQFYLEVEYGAGDNSYGAIFYWGTDQIAAAIHDGDQYECGPPTFNYDRGDTAPACAGFLAYANTASYAALDAYLPSHVAAAIVSARSTAAFTSVASVAAVNGVAEARLQDLLSAARTAGLVGPSCSGIYDQIAASVAEATAMTALVNEASADELHGVLSFLINQGVVDTLRAARPVAGAAAIAGATGVGPAVFRALRNAATRYRPWEDLVAEVNQIDHPDGQYRIDLHFDWVPLVTGATGFTEMTCFGVSPSLLPSGAVNRALLGNSNEVMENVGEVVGLANRFDELPISPTPGFYDVEHRATGHTFLGCYIAYHPDPWTYDRVHFFVNRTTGEGMLLTHHYVE